MISPTPSHSRGRVVAVEARKKRVALVTRKGAASIEDAISQGFGASEMASAPPQVPAQALLAFSNLAHEVIEGELTKRELLEMARDLIGKHGDVLRSAALAVKAGDAG